MSAPHLIRLNRLARSVRLNRLVRCLSGLAALVVLHAAGTAATAATAGFAHAASLQGLSDPTRPPPGVARSDKASAANPGRTDGATAAQAASAAASAASQAAAPKPQPLRLQAIRFDERNGRSVALVNDVLLEPGARLKEGGWQLVAIGRNDVVFQGPRGRVRLSLLGESQIDKTPAGASPQRGRKE